MTRGVVLKAAYFGLVALALAGLRALMTVPAGERYFKAHHDAYSVAVGIIKPLSFMTPPLVPVDVMLIGLALVANAAYAVYWGLGCLKTATQGQSTHALVNGLSAALGAVALLVVLRFLGHGFPALFASLQVAGSGLEMTAVRLRPAGAALLPVAGLVFVLAAYRVRKVSSLFALFASIAAGLSGPWVLWSEYARLSSWTAQYNLRQLIFTYADGYAFLAGAAALVAVIVMARRSLSGAVLPWSEEKTEDNIDRTGSALHGSASWMPIKRATEIFSDGGLILGEAYRVDKDKDAQSSFDPRDPKTWGQGGRPPLLRYDGNLGNGHSMFFAGSGGFKSTSTVVPTCLEWPHSLVVLDPSGEAAQLTGDDRRRQGFDVHTLDPAAGNGGFNVLGWVKPGAGDVLDNVKAVAAWIGDEKPSGKSSGGDFFGESSTGLIMLLVAEAVLSLNLPDEDRTLRTVRQRLTMGQEKLQTHIGELISEDEMHPLVIELAGTYHGMVAETWSGVYANAAKSTLWLSSPPLADLVSGGAFDSSTLVNGKTTVYVNIPLKTLQSTPAAARVVLGALMNAHFEAAGAHEGRTLFMLDEVFQLGYMKILEQARDTGRKYGISISLIYQSLGQCIDQWGQNGKKAWFDSTTFRSFAVVSDPDTQAEVSKICGTYTASATSKSSSSGRSHGKADVIGSSSKNESESQSETRRELIKPDEIGRLRADEQIVILNNEAPIRCGRALYFRRPELLSRVSESQFG